MTSRASSIPSTGPDPELGTRICSIIFPEPQAARYKLYICLAILLYVIAWGLVLVRARIKHEPPDFAVADAVGFYVYLPSLVIDGDLKFENQLLVQHRGMIPSDFGRAPRDDGWAVDATRNRWPIGIAVSVAPGFVVAHGLSHLLYPMTGWEALAPNGYSILYFVLCIATAMAIGVGGMMVADRLLVERYKISGRITAAAVLTWWLGTNFVWFFVREPLIAHMIGASYVTFAAYFVHHIEIEARTEGRLAWWRLGVLALLGSLIVTCRFTNVVVFPLFAYALIVLVRYRLLASALKQLPLIVLGLAPLIAQVLILYMMTGEVVPSRAKGLGYPRWEKFYWTDPALVKTLFSSQRGLFFWTPVLLLAAWGLIGYLRRGGWRDPLVVSLLLAFVGMWYINASWYAWWMGNSMGHRGFLELGALFIIGFGLAYTRMEQMPLPAQRALVILILGGVLFNYVLVGLKLLDRLDGQGPLLSWEARVLTGRWKRF